MSLLEHFLGVIGWIFALRFFIQWRLERHFRLRALEIAREARVLAREANEVADESLTLLEEDRKTNRARLIVRQRIGNN